MKSIMSEKSEKEIFANEFMAEEGLKGKSRRIKIIRIIDMVGFYKRKIKNNYRIHEQDELANIFEEKIEKFYLKNITDRVREYFAAIK